MFTFTFIFLWSPHRNVLLPTSLAIVLLLKSTLKLMMLMLSNPPLTSSLAHQLQVMVVTPMFTRQIILVARMEKYDSKIPAGPVL